MTFQLNVSEKYRQQEAEKRQDHNDKAIKRALDEKKRKAYFAERGISLNEKSLADCRPQRP